MTQDGRCRVTLIGPPGAGKTGLLLSLFPALGPNKQIHAYGQDQRFETSSPDAIVDGDLFQTVTNSLDEEFQDYLEQYKGLTEPTPVDRTEGHTFEITHTDYSSDPPRRGRKVSIEVYDTGGEILGWDHYQNVRETRQARSDGRDFDKSIADSADLFEKYFLASNAVILVLPILNLSQTAYYNVAIQNFLTGIIRQPKSELLQIIIAWSQADRLLAPYGTGAFAIANDREAQASILRNTLIHNQQMGRLIENLQRAAPETGRKPPEIIHMLVSTHGFLDWTGAPHIDFRERPVIWAGSTPDGGAVREYWFPYHAADPFLVAAFGSQGNAACFSHDEVMNGLRKPELPAEKEERAGHSRWRSLFSGRRNKA